jgi:hypothetical protein
VCGSDELVWSSFLVIRGHSVPVVRQKLHLSSCADFRDRLSQLSYSFHPRRHRRGSRHKPENFRHSLRALAIRQNKIHATDLPDLTVDGTPIYLDVEGLPDRNFYYLIGVRLRTGGEDVQYSFWADDEDGEKRIWTEFIDLLSAIPDPRLISSQPTTKVGKRTTMWSNSV